MYWWATRGASDFFVDPGYRPVRWGRLSEVGLILRFVGSGQVAQLVEQRTENPCVGSSILPLATDASAYAARP
jgi:hypothetical protein